MVVECGANEGIGEERERFWNDLDRTTDTVGNGCRLYMCAGRPERMDWR